MAGVERKPTGGSPTSRRSAVRVAGEFVAVRVRAADAEVIVMEPESDVLLSGRECAARLGISPVTWRSAVRRGVAPPPDDPDEGRPVGCRLPRWRTSTVDAYAARRRRPGRPSRVLDGWQ